MYKCVYVINVYALLSTLIIVSYLTSQWVRSVWQAKSRDRSLSSDGGEVGRCDRVDLNNYFPVWVYLYARAVCYRQWRRQEARHPRKFIILTDFSSEVIQRPPHALPASIVSFFTVLPSLSVLYVRLLIVLYQFISSSYYYYYYYYYVNVSSHRVCTFSIIYDDKSLLIIFTVIFVCLYLCY